MADNCTCRHKHSVYTDLCMFICSKYTLTDKYIDSYLQTDRLTDQTTDTKCTNIQIHVIDRNTV